MTLSNFRIIKNEFLSKYPNVVSEQSPIIILNSKSAVRMTKNGKETKHNRHISIRMHFVRNCEE